MATSTSETVATFGLVCPSDSFRTTEREARFCKKCGRVLRHPCPHCRALLDTGSAHARALSRCPRCWRALWQCRECRWVAPLGTPRCANPRCDPASLQPTRAFGMVGGNAGRTGEYRRERAPMPAPGIEEGLTVAPVPGRAISVVAGMDSFLVLMDAPELYVIEPGDGLMPDGGAGTPEARRVTLPFRPREATDALAVCGDTQVYVLGREAAYVLELHPESVQVQERVEGTFAAQVVTRSGWFLVEETSEGPRFHRRAAAGSDRGVGPERFPSRLAEPSFLLPAANEIDVYWADAEGQAWRCSWQGGPARKVGSPAGAASTCMLDGDELFVLPVLKQGYGRRIRLTTGEEDRFPVGERMPLASAVATRARENQLWLGSNSAPCAVVLNREMIAGHGAAPPGVPGPVQQLCAVHVSREKTAILAVLSDVSGLYLRGWWAEAPYFGLPGLSARTLSRPISGGRIVVGEPWILFWHASEHQTSFVLNCLPCNE